MNIHKKELTAKEEVAKPRKKINAKRVKTRQIARKNEYLKVNN